MDPEPQRVLLGEVEVGCASSSKAPFAPKVTRFTTTFKKEAVLQFQELVYLVDSPGVRGWPEEVQCPW
jgi:hypothetical protein